MKIKIVVVFLFFSFSLFSQSDLCDDGGFEVKDFFNNGWTLKTYERLNSNPPGNFNNNITLWTTINNYYTKENVSFRTNSCPISGFNLNWFFYYNKNLNINGNCRIFNNHTGVGAKCLTMGALSWRVTSENNEVIQNLGQNTIEGIDKKIIVNESNRFIKFYFSGGVSTASRSNNGYFAVIVNGISIPINIINSNGSFNAYNPFYYNNENFNLFGFCDVVYHEDWGKYTYRKINSQEAFVDLSQFYGQTINFEFVNADPYSPIVNSCYYEGFYECSITHLDNIICSGFDDMGSVYLDNKQSSTNCNAKIFYDVPSFSNLSAKLKVIKIFPYKNGVQVQNISPYIITNNSLGSGVFNVSRQTLKDYWGSLNNYDIVAEAYFDYKGTEIIRKSNVNGDVLGIDNDISFADGNINMYYDNGVGCNLYLAAYPPILNGIQGRRISWALRAYKNGVPIPGSPAMDPMPFNLPNNWINQPVVGLAYINMFWNGYKDYDLVFEATYTLCGKTYTYKTDVNGLVAGMNNDIVDPKYKAETLTTNSDNCTTTTTITYPTVLPYSTFENKCKIDRKDFGVLNYKFDGVNGFTNYPASIGSGYNYMTKNTSFDCDNDILTHEIQYKCMGCKDEYIAKMTVATKCVITLCDQFECKPAAGSLLNPYLSNVKGNVQAKGQYVFNTKRVSFSASQSLKNSSYYSEFEPFYSNASNKWNKSTHTSWISTATVENISKYGQSVETKNPLSIYSVMKYGFGQSLPIISANDARYHEVAFFSFEDKDYEQTNNTGFKFDRDYFPLTSTANQNPDVYKVGNAENAAVVKDEAHTGKYSYYIQPKNNSNAAYTAKFIELCGPDTDNSNLFKENYYIDVAGAKANDKSYSAEFQPERGKKYLITYWTKSKPSSNIGEQGYIDVKFDCDINYTSSDVKSNQVKQVEIEGWSLMSKEIEIPKDVKIMKIVFNPCSSGSYFDDIRFSPINSVLKTYVYNPKILKHVAELDENNYATFYDYDEMGNLVRIRKETERGIMTIKEGRMNLKDN
jgi:hypothetical protein